MSENETPAPEAGEVVIPESTVVSETPEPEIEGQETEDAGASEEQKSKSKLRRERRQAEAERLRQSEADARAKLEEAERRVEELRAVSAAPKLPQQKDFATYEDFQAALAAHKTLQALDQRDITKAEADARVRAAEIKALDAQKERAFKETVAFVNEDGKARYADYDAVVQSPSVAMTPAMVAVIAEADDPGELAYQIAKNPQLSQSLAQMHPVHMARAIGRMEAQISATRNTVSSAPSPITPVTPKAKPTTDPSKMTPDQYAAWRAKGGTFNR